MLARTEPTERHTLSVVVDNEAGVLARIVGLFSSRGYNIESLTVADVSAEAERLGTYPISIIPDQDCCTLFTPRHPATRARMTDVERAELQLPMDELVTRAIGEAQLEEFHFPAVESPVGGQQS